MSPTIGNVPAAEKIVQDVACRRARHGADLCVGVAAALLALLGAAPATQAQTYSQRPITLIVPFVPGGAADTTARIMAEAIARHLGQNLVVENVSGAGGATGSTRGKLAKPDGYTIGLGHMGTHAASVGINPNLAYDPRTDFDYLGLVSTTPNIVIVRRDFPADSAQEFIAYAKAKGPALKMGHSGIGAASHVGCVLFFQLIDARPTLVTYRGFGQTINDVLSGEIDGTCDLVASVTGLIAAGSVKGLVVAVDERAPTLPHVPTAAEIGLPDFKAETWTGLYAPKGLPTAILTRLREAVAASLAEPALQKRLFDIGATLPKPEHQGGDYMLQLVTREVERWSAVLKKAGVQP